MRDNGQIVVLHTQCTTFLKKMIDLSSSYGCYLVPLLHVATEETHRSPRVALAHAFRREKEKEPSRHRASTTSAATANIQKSGADVPLAPENVYTQLWILDEPGVVLKCQRGHASHRSSESAPSSRPYVRAGHSSHRDIPRFSLYVPPDTGRTRPTRRTRRSALWRTARSPPGTARPPPR